MMNEVSGACGQIVKDDEEDVDLIYYDEVPSARQHYTGGGYQ